MTAPADNDPVITGMGMFCAAATDVAGFDRALRTVATGIRDVDLLGRRVVAAPLPELSLDERLSNRGLSEVVRARVAQLGRRCSVAVQAELLAAAEALQSAGMSDAADDDSCALIVCGSNLTSRESLDLAQRHRDDFAYVPPSHAATHFDSDRVGCLSEAFRIHGAGFTIGAASASGNLGLLQGARLVGHEDARRCLVVGAVTTLSAMELQAFSGSGALAVDAAGGTAGALCRPFDRDRRGFVYGEGAAALIIEPRAAARARGVVPLARIRGGACVLDGARGTQPSSAGEARAMESALRNAGVEKAAIDYVNAHGTASLRGDEAEAEAIASIFGEHRPWVNSTKAITGHCLSSAALLETIACVLQMRGGFVHGNLNLANPVRADVRFAGVRGETEQIRHAINNSFAFGGINSAVILSAEGQ